MRERQLKRCLGIPPLSTAHVCLGRPKKIMVKSLRARMIHGSRSTGSIIVTRTVARINTKNPLQDAEDYSLNLLNLRTDGRPVLLYRTILQPALQHSYGLCLDFDYFFLRPSDHDQGKLASAIRRGHCENGTCEPGKDEYRYHQSREYPEISLLNSSEVRPTLK